MTTIDATVAQPDPAQADATLMNEGTKAQPVPSNLKIHSLIGVLVSSTSWACTRSWCLLTMPSSGLVL